VTTPCRSGMFVLESASRSRGAVGTHPLRMIASASVWLVALGAWLSASWTLAVGGSAHGSNGRSLSEVVMFGVVRRSSASVVGSPQMARHAASRSDDAVIASASPASVPAAEASRSRSSRPIAERRATESSPFEMAAGWHGTLASDSRDAMEPASRCTAKSACRGAVVLTACAVAVSASSGAAVNVMAGSAVGAADVSALVRATASDRRRVSVVGVVGSGPVRLEGARGWLGGSAGLGGEGAWGWLGGLMG